jgi:hypothetical protein
VLFADDLPPLADGPRWAQHALRIAADYPGHIPALLPAVWLPPRRNRDPSQGGRSCRLSRRRIYKHAIRRA